MNIVALKVIFLDEDFEYDSFISMFIHFVSQVYKIKKSVFRRLRRKKRFKKNGGFTHPSRHGDN